MADRDFTAKTLSTGAVVAGFGLAISAITALIACIAAICTRIYIVALVSAFNHKLDHALCGATSSGSRFAAKQRERQELEATKERECEELAAAKERECEERSLAEEREREELAAKKQREKLEAKQREETKKRERQELAAAKEREREERAVEEEREREELAAKKQREKLEAAKQREHEKLEAQRQELAALIKRVFDAVDAFEVLGLPSSECLSSAQVKRARHDLQKQLHPDRVSLLDPGQLTAATEASMRVNAAADALADAELCAAYLTSGSAGTNEVFRQRRLQKCSEDDRYHRELDKMQQQRAAATMDNPSSNPAEPQASSVPRSPEMQRSSSNPPGPESPQKTSGRHSTLQFAIGTVVILHDLQSATWLNGKQGCVVGFDKDGGRFDVRMDSDGTVKKIKAANLTTPSKSPSPSQQAPGSTPTPPVHSAKSPAPGPATDSRSNRQDSTPGQANPPGRQPTVPSATYTSRCHQYRQDRQYCQMPGVSGQMAGPRPVFAQQPPFNMQRSATNSVPTSSSTAGFARTTASSIWPNSVILGPRSGLTAAARFNPARVS